MGSQFVDFNADGHLDYLTATFDGSPHISYGGKEGFGTPERLKDAQGQRILISSFWNYEDEEHQTTSRAMPEGKTEKERCISALAFDWDGDGDHDLLLGSYENGHLYRQMNEGTNAKPKFTGKNIPVMAGDRPFALSAKMTAPRLVDWDGDGDMDLIAGSFGDSYGHDSKGGGVYLSRNGGGKGKPAFGALETLIPPSPKGWREVTRPDAGLYADAVDHDGDGDLDLVVGAYSMWTPKGRQLSAVEKAEVAILRKQQQDHRKRQSEFYARRNQEVAKATAGLDRKSEEHQKRRMEVYAKYSDEATALTKEGRGITKKLEARVPGPQRKAYVWLYERLSAEKKPAGGN